MTGNLSIYRRGLDQGLSQDEIRDAYLDAMREHDAEVAERRRKITSATLNAGWWLLMIYLVIDGLFGWYGSGFEAGMRTCLAEPAACSEKLTKVEKRAFWFPHSAALGGVREVPRDPHR